MRVNGIRGRYLITWAVGYLAMGLSYIIAPTPGRMKAFSWLPMWDNPDAWGWIWMAAGLIALMTAFRPGHKRVNPHDRWGFTALFIPPAVWTVIYSTAVFVTHSIDPLATVGIFLPMALGQLIASEIENRVDRQTVEPAEGPIRKE